MVDEVTHFHSRLYPKQFGEGYVYASIETKAVGVTIYLRIIYKFKNLYIETITQRTYGVKGNHVLHSWRVVDSLAVLEDYGYGGRYPPVVVVRPESPKATRVVVREEPKVAPRRVVVKQKGCPNGYRHEMYSDLCMVVF